MRLTIRLREIHSVVILAFLAVFAFSCKEAKTDRRRINFPHTIEYINALPKKENFWIFILAGQSNMAGRGLVGPDDTVSVSNILSIDTTLQWYQAKEPLHFYEPGLKGLDCGLSFGKELFGELTDTIYIGLIPCAVGGSSVEQWLGDSLHRKVKLLSNFESKVKLAAEAGVIKGILWHQGESNAHEEKIRNYKTNLQELFKRFRTLAGNDSLPILAAELGYFLTEKNGNYPDSLNRILKEMATSDRNMSVISASDLTHKGDTLHFDAAALRLLGKRYAEAYKSILK